jgi:ArsR family transcriptional regulator
MRGGDTLQQIPNKETMERIAELFKAFADPTRVQILSNLVEQELCVTDISEAVELSQSAVSHQLRILKQMHLVKYRRDGKNLWYSLADDHVLTILQMGLEHVLE